MPRRTGISVVIPTYNRSGLIRRTVHSALAAVGPGDEIIVIDDGSTDNSEEVLRPYFDRIRYIRSENRGAGAARNLGVAVAQQPLVAFLDSDDEWLPDKLYLQRAVMDAFPEAALCFSDLLSHHQNGKTYHHVLKIWANDGFVGHPGARGDVKDFLGPAIPFSSIAALPQGRPDFGVHVGNIYGALMEFYYVWTCAVVVRREIAGASFLFPEDMSIYEEWECFARLARSRLVAYLDCETAIQNVHGGPRLTDANEILQSTTRISLLHRVWGADEAFMTKHAERFQRVMNVHHVRRAKYLIKAGRMAEAMQDLIAAGGGPWSYRLLTKLPAHVTNSLVQTRRRLRGELF